MSARNGRRLKTNLQHIKYQDCPSGHKQAILRVRVENESLPYTDDAGNKQYHCLVCHRTFSIAKQ